MRAFLRAARCSSDPPANWIGGGISVGALATTLYALLTGHEVLFTLSSGIDLGYLIGTVGFLVFGRRRTR